MLLKIRDFMKRNYRSILAVLILAAGISAFAVHQRRVQQDREAKERVTLQAMNYVLQNFHYHPQILNNKFSEEVFDEFIKSIDGGKRYLLQADIDSLARYRHDIDDEIRTLRFDFFDLAFRLIAKRQKEAEKIYHELLDERLDFSLNDSITWDYDKLSWARNRSELKNRWRKALKYSILTDMQQEWAMQADSLPKKDLLSFREKGRKNAKKNFDQLFENLHELERADYMAVYLNTIARMYDPHTNYFKPADRERFDMDMSGSFEGIGARLQKEGAYTKIVELIPGGPAWRGGKLEVGDIILKVRQEDEKEPVDAVGMRLDKLVKLIKGPKGTTVYLTVKKLNGNIEVIPIVRDKVILEETFAKSLLIKHNGKTYGYILLPKFYHNFDDKNDRNSASDMRKELKKLLENGAQGVIIDLRNNGGGSLADVIEIAGDFIDRGPVVQVENQDHQRRTYKDPNGGILWDKPVVVMVNELSASASEILAAALQDYRRAIVIGGDHTYGKGTVQRFVDLTRIAGVKSMGNLGSLKWTTQKFYRITGKSTQRRGVVPDIKLPDRYRYLKISEKDEKHALPYSTIRAAEFKPWNGYTNLDQTISVLQQAVDTMLIFKNLDSLARWFARNSERKTYPLNKDAFQALMKRNKQIANHLDSITRYENHLHFESLPQDTVGRMQDTVFTSQRKRWIENLGKDPYVEQALRALEMLKTTKP